MMKALKKQGQSVVEYTLIVGIVVTVITLMATMISRSSKGMIKVVSDKTGTQENAEQYFESGYLVNSYTETTSNPDKRVQDFLGTMTYTFDDSVSTTREAFMNLGFSEL